MAKKLDDYIESVVFGIRFRANFGLDDYLGRITEEMLHSGNKVINNTLFPQVMHDLNEKLLFGKMEGARVRNSLKINNTSITLDVKLSDMPGERSETKIKELYADFEKVVVKDTLGKYKVADINRIGYVRRYWIDNPKIAGAFVKSSFGEGGDGLGDINLSFIRKFPPEKSILKQGQNDYNSVIHNFVRRASDNLLVISVDYQKNFDPPLDTAYDLEFDEFVADAVKYNNEDFSKWFKDKYGEIE